MGQVEVAHWGSLVLYYDNHIYTLEGHGNKDIFISSSVLEDTIASIRKISSKLVMFKIFYIFNIK